MQWCAPFPIKNRRIKLAITKLDGWKNGIDTFIPVKTVCPQPENRHRITAAEGDCREIPVLAFRKVECSDSIILTSSRICGKKRIVTLWCFWLWCKDKQVSVTFNCCQGQRLLLKGSLFYVKILLSPSSPSLSPIDSEYPDAAGISPDIRRSPHKRMPDRRCH